MRRNLISTRPSRTPSHHLSILSAMGAYLSVFDDTYPPKPQFSVDDIPDLTGKVVIVTGANTGEDPSASHLGPHRLTEAGS